MGLSSRAVAAFDRGYYQKYYFNPRTAVTSRHETNARARLVTAYAGHIGAPVRRILDAGCGTGMLRAPLLRAFPRALYVGIEVSEYLCKRYGWIRSSIEDYTTAHPFDLVICYDVLQYLSDRQAARALNVLGDVCLGLLYFTALTSEDWQENCDRRRTDSKVHLRPAAWYRTRLRRKFREVGAGFWIRQGAPLVTWSLEAVD
jgi:SAM-dependent methyltransferase